MFGFGKNSTSSQNDEWMRKHQQMIDDADSSMQGLWGTSDPELIDQQMRRYMPGLMGKIDSTNNKVDHIDDSLFQNGKNQVAINENINVKHEEVMEELRSLRLQNQELLAKYNALVERMAGYIERENGKGR